MTKIKHSGESSIMRRRHILKYIILGALLLLTPISLMLGRWRRSSRSYQWKDTPGENIPLPDEVCGQKGSEVCASPDGRTIVVAGNRVIPQDIFEQRKREPALTLLCYKYFIYKSSDFGKNFECVYRSPSPGGVASMALSPVNSRQLAFIAVEFQTTVPETEAEMSRMASDPKKRAALAEEYAMALQARDLRISLYLCDTEQKTPPRMLCALDNFPWKLTGRAKTDLTQFNESQIKLLNEMNTFRESGILMPWQDQLLAELQSKTITWLPDGNALLVSDGFSLTKVDLSGKKSSFYTPNNSLGSAMIRSNLYCRTSGEFSFLERGRRTNVLCLTRLDQDGTVLSKTQEGVFSFMRHYFEEPFVLLVGEHKIAETHNKPENMYDAVLRTLSLSPNMGDWKDVVDWEVHAKEYDIHDPNRVQFYYQAKAFCNGEDEVLIFKRRACGLTGPREGAPNWEWTPWTPENAAAPWVELRKMKIS